MDKKMKYQDILYNEKDGIATITINRPKKYNAFRFETVEELIHAFNKAGWKKNIGAIVLTGAGDKAFCTGGDQSSHDNEDSSSGYGGRGIVGLPIEDLQTVIRDVPKPGPKMGAVDPGFGTALLAKTVGEKKAREIWYLCRRYTASEALDMGLCNKVVPIDKLDEEVNAWCSEIMDKSPTALAIAKRSFNASTEYIRGIGSMGMQSVAMYYDTEESKEGVKAFLEKRKPNFRKHSK